MRPTLERDSRRRTEAAGRRVDAPMSNNDAEDVLEIAPPWPGYG
ncbi:MAG: hypothetical protein OXG37_04000 [Actinomycetia bacterium]|nr:hypothetical protein [Actinomycetes bacterium]